MKEFPFNFEKAISGEYIIRNKHKEEFYVVPVLGTNQKLPVRLLRVTEGKLDGREYWCTLSGRFLPDEDNSWDVSLYEKPTVKQFWLGSDGNLSEEKNCIGHFDHPPVYMIECDKDGNVL